MTARLVKMLLHTTRLVISISVQQTHLPNKKHKLKVKYHNSNKVKLFTETFSVKVLQRNTVILLILH